MHYSILFFSFVSFFFFKQKTAYEVRISDWSSDVCSSDLLGIRLVPAIAAIEAPIAVIPAVIQPPANARVAVAATFPGVVMRTLVVEGDTVRQGQPLAIISSRDVLTMGADLTRANARAGVARSNAARLSQLAREGIQIGRAHV